MLTLTLRGLERDGLVTRTGFPTIQPRVDYETGPISDAGRSQPVEAPAEGHYDLGPESKNEAGAGSIGPQ